ncbi:MAG: nucleotidyl transferase AbiEii/AbiGii toxin family protein [Chloroflexi bacterium]|nr:nucleotidyl transferase AbiEii/AbiGii toxin family protein [Chloroflexota bacterium]
MKQANTNHYESVSANTCCVCANQTSGNPHCVDTNPPSHARLTTTPLDKYVPLNLQHHDPATLLAGKLSALLQRDYLKGRDVYDLWWYLNQPNWPEPNLEYLNQCLQQGGWGHDALTPANWRTCLRCARNR